MVHDHLAVMHGLRKIMGNRDALSQLTYMVEFDEDHLGKEVPQRTKSNLKRGRVSDIQIDEAVMAESIPDENLVSGKISNHCIYYKMKVQESHKSTEVASILKDTRI